MFVRIAVIGVVTVSFLLLATYLLQKDSDDLKLPPTNLGTSSSTLPIAEVASRERVSVIVYDAHGKSIDGVSLALTLEGKNYQSQTDSDGSCSFNVGPGQYELVAEHPIWGRLGRTVDIDGTDSSIELRYEADAQIFGSLLETENMRVFELQIATSSGAEFLDPAPRAKIDISKEGPTKYRVDRLVPGDYE